MFPSNAPKLAPEINRVGLIFSGGPAPGANAVISAAATSFIEDGREVVGFLYGYSNLERYDAETSPLVEGEHYKQFDERDLRGLRNQRGIIVGTARANPGRYITCLDDFKDEERVAPLKRVYNALVDHGIQALISIGGDDTLKTANFLYEYQRYLPEDAPRIKVIHLPKTIDNDYSGIDFTFGYFTAVDVMAKELMNLRADALATSSYYIVETMGRKAGWLSYGVAIAGEAHLVLGVEDLGPDICVQGADSKPRLCLEKLADKIVKLIVAREGRQKHYGTVVLAEGMGEHLADEYLSDAERDEHGHIALAKIDFAKRVTEAVAQRYKDLFGRKKKVTPIQLGYESRCSPPHAFDVMLGSQLGIGAYRGLVEQGLDGHMVSICGQFDLRYVPFSELIDQETMLTSVRFVEPGSHFQALARFLETRLDADALPLGRRREG